MSAAAPCPKPDLRAALSTRVIGQRAAIDAIIPLIETYQAGLNAEHRPAGVLLLLGPTGTGKTHSIEALAEVLHGDKKQVVKVDCGEFQHSHEIAKLIGSPPGYLGHRETQARLTQAKLAQVTSPASNLSLVLFDEIEKASDAVSHLLLGILDKATLHLGDGAIVDFQNSLIFLTSNLGARDLLHRSKFGFGPKTVDSGQRQRHSEGAVKRNFSPEFVNRLDALICYEPLTREDANAILDLLLAEFRKLLQSRLGERAFHLLCGPEARKHLLDGGVSAEYGARGLKRTLQRQVIQPIATMTQNGEIPSGATVVLSSDGRGLVFEVRA